MRILEAVRQGEKVRHRHIESLGPYSEIAYKRYREIVADWKPLTRPPVVLKDLGEKSGRPQGRGYFRKLWR